MLLFTKETDVERIKRLRKSIIDNYIEDDSSTKLLVSESDLKFIFLKAEEQVGFEAESSTGQTSIEEISTIPTTEYQESMIGGASVGNFTTDHSNNNFDNNNDDPF